MHWRTKPFLKELCATLAARLEGIVKISMQQQSRGAALLMLLKAGLPVCIALAH